MSERSRDAFEANLMEEVQRQEKIRQRERLMHEWLQMAARVIVLANGAGAVATVGFLGATFKDRGSVGLEALALVLFIAGIIFPGAVMVAQAHRLWSDLRPDRFMPAWLVPFMDRLSFAPGLLFLSGAAAFILGAVLGILALLFR